MKKNAQFRLKLSRETLRTLAGPEIEAAQGGNNSAACGSLSCYVTCGCPPPLTHSCPTICGLQCSATSNAC
jgi:hypothetical protein